MTPEEMDVLAADLWDFVVCDHVREVELYGENPDPDPNCQMCSDATARGLWTESES